MPAKSEDLYIMEVTSPQIGLRPLTIRLKASSLRGAKMEAGKYCNKHNFHSCFISRTRIVEDMGRERLSTYKMATRDADGAWRSNHSDDGEDPYSALRGRLNSLGIYNR